MNLLLLIILLLLLLLFYRSTSWYRMMHPIRWEISQISTDQPRTQVTHAQKEYTVVLYPSLFYTSLSQECFCYSPYFRQECSCLLFGRPQSLPRTTSRASQPSTTSTFSAICSVATPGTTSASHSSRYSKEERKASGHLLVSCARSAQGRVLHSGFWETHNSFLQVPS